jgi:hypothetical protein
MSHISEISTAKCRIRLIEPNLIENFVLDHSYIQVDDILEAKRINQELANDQPFVALLTFGKMTEVSQKAREQIANKEHRQNVEAKAILVDNIGHRLLGNFYLYVNKPHIRTKLFTDRQVALKWLRLELKKELNPIG